MNVDITAIKSQQIQLDTYNTVDKLNTIITTLCDTKYALKLQQTQLEPYNTVDKLKNVITTLCDAKYALKV